MVLTLQQVFGTNASQTGTEITFDYTDFSNTGLGVSNPSPTQILCAFLKYLDSSLEEHINDPTIGVSPPSFKQDYTFVTRGTTKQVSYPIQLNFYVPNTISDLDPDDVV